MTVLTIPRDGLYNAKQYLKQFAYACLGSVIIALSSPLSFVLPFSVIPITLQVHIALLVAFLLGRKTGALAVLLFLLQGIAGYPVFAAGAFGLANFLGPRGGYLIGYFIAALVMSNSKIKTQTQVFFKLGLGNLVVYLFGYIWLSLFIGGLDAFTLGIIPFVVGDFIKLMVITKLTSFFCFYSTN